MHKKVLLYTLIAFILGALTFLLYSNYEKAKEHATYLNSLTFSNTQEWDPLFKQSALNTNDSPDISLPPPPKNTSAETLAEIALLKQYEELRTPEKLAEIEAEKILDGAYFGDKTFSELVASNTRPYTHRLFAGVTTYEMGIIFNEKDKFDRIRPSILDSSLTTAIDIPPHPAYPSGHATQSHLRALIFGELDPQNKASYKESAERISKNREIAGVHYPSDSKAGEILASQIFSQLMQNEAFVSLLEQAKTEW